MKQPLKADRVLVDEDKARKVAKDRGLNVTGTLGVLEAAAIKGLIDLEREIDALEKTNYWIGKETLDAVREAHRQREQAKRNEPEHEL